MAKQNTKETSIANVASENIVILDVFNILFRFYSSHPRMSSQDDHNVNGLYGYCRLLSKIIIEGNAKFIIAAMDSGSESGIRKKILPSYKANRQPLADDLLYQISQLDKIHDAFNIFVAMSTGYEADDIIAAASKFYNSNKAVIESSASKSVETCQDLNQSKGKKDFEIIIFSSDKDLAQLVGDQVKLYNPFKGINLNSEAIKEKFGVFPNQIADLIALSGDPSDNFPGIRGIGPITAAKLLSEYDSIDNLYSAINDDKCSSISERIKKTLVEEEETLSKCRQLSKLYDNAFNNFPIKLQKPIMTLKTLNLLNDFEFYSIVNEYENKLDQNDDSSNPNSIKMIDKIVEERNSDLDLKLARGSASSIAKGVTEIAITVNQDNKLEILYKSNDKLYFLLADKEDPEIQEIFSNAGIYKVFSNHQDALDIIPNQEVANFHYLDLMRYAAKTFSYNPEVKKVITPLQKVLASLDQSLQYLAKNKCYYVYETDRQLVKVLSYMAKDGVKINVNLLQKIGDKIEIKSKKIEHKIFQEAGEEFSIGSPKKLNYILFDKLKLQTENKRRTKTGLFPTDRQSLLSLAQSGSYIAKLILKWRHHQKLASTYIRGLLKRVDENNFIRSRFLLTRTITGRIASQSPNLQNIPTRTKDGLKIRSCFETSFHGGALISCDYSQMEMYILAKLTNSQKLQEIIDSGNDIHLMTAAKLFSGNDITPEQRRMAKIINFGIIYGISAYSLSQRTHLSVQEAQEFIEKYMDEYPEIKNYIDRITKFAEINGFVHTLFGRRCSIRRPMGGNYKSTIGKFRRAAINAPIQGTAADIMRKSLVEVCWMIRRKKLRSKLVLQIHDEIVVDSPADEIDEMMEILPMEMNKCGMPFIHLNSQPSYSKTWSKCQFERR